MEVVDIHEAKSQLSKLIERALQGEEVVIPRAGTPVVWLAPILADASPRLGGQWKRRVAMADEFDAPPDDLAEAFGMTPE
jgi:prevent-host-death family protein